MSSLNELQVIPGYQLGQFEALTNSVLNLMAKPTVNFTLTDPIGSISYWRNGNFYSGFWTTPSGISCPAGVETLNAAFWSVNPTGAAVTYKQSTVTPDTGSVYSIEIDGATSVTDVRLTQTLSPDFSGVLRGNITISGWMLNSTGATVTPVLELWSCNTLGSFSSITKQLSTSMQSCPVGIWTYCSITVDCDVTNVLNGLSVRILLPNPALSGSTFKWNFSRLQLQQGSVATPFLDDINLFATLPTIVNANLGAGCVDIVNCDSTITSALTLTGSVIDWAGVAIPTGWLTCDGSAVSRSSQSALFNILNGSSTGNVTSGSPTISVTSSTPFVGPGFFFVSGPGIPVGAKITSVSGTSVTLNVNCTASGTGVTIWAGPWGLGNGSTTFNLPDLRGRVTVGVGVGSGLTSRLLGPNSQGGEETHILTTAELATHNHTISDPGHVHTLNDPGHLHGISDSGHQHGYLVPDIVGLAAGGSGFGSNNSTFANTANAASNVSVQTGVTSITVASHTTGITTVNNGSGTAHNNMPPFVGIFKIIKT